MPELPEVETIARGLALRVVDDEITSVWLGKFPEPLKSPGHEIAATLEGARIAKVQRVGKQIVFQLSKRRGKRKEAETSCWIVHLGMSGRLLLVHPDQEIAKHTHAIIQLASGKELRFVDPRRFGRLAVASSFAVAGKEPLKIKFEVFAGLFKGRKTPIKSALLNQKLLGGIGNIYADESLFRARLRPSRRASRLSQAELHRLYESVQRVLREAISARGSSVSNYVDSSGESGLFQTQHRVYKKTGKPCVVCRTPIKRSVIAGRSTHYCPHCQR